MPRSQGPVRSNAEAFLGRKIVVCEGPTEIGSLRALDEYKVSNEGSIPVWSLNTSYFNAAGIGNVVPASLALKELGYQVAVLCDNDEPDQFSVNDIKKLQDADVKVFCWNNGNSIEQQLFNDLNWNDLSGILECIAGVHDSKNKESLIQSVQDKVHDLPKDFNQWLESNDLRKAIGLAAAGKKDQTNKNNKNAWFKRIDYSEAVFTYAIPRLASDRMMKIKFEELWEWIQNG